MLQMQGVAITQHTPEHPSKMKSTQEHPWDPAHSCPHHPEPCQGLGQHRAPSPAHSPGFPAASSLIIARLSGRQRSARPLPACLPSPKVRQSEGQQ